MGRSTEEVLDDWLVLAAQGGEARAFETLARRWHRRLIAHAYRRIGHPEGAAEAAQDSWLAIVRGLPGLDDPSRFPAWAYRIVDRKAVDWIRRKHRDRSVGSEMEPVPEAADPSHDGRVPDDLERLRRLIAAMPSEHRALLALFYADDRAVREIAEALGIPEGTVKSRLFHARAYLKQRMGDRR